MIYHLFQLLKEYDIPGQGLMNYLSFRAFLASATAMLFSLLVGKKIIALLQRKQIGETVRDLGLQGQIEKKGTPTMGGVIIILSILTAVLLFCDLTNVYVLLLLLSTLWCGALGFTDDYINLPRSCWAWSSGSPSGPATTSSSGKRWPFPKRNRKKS